LIEFNFEIYQVFSLLIDHLQMLGLPSPDPLGHLLHRALLLRKLLHHLTHLMLELPHSVFSFPGLSGGLPRGGLKLIPLFPILICLKTLLN
jgi:hypothetical protein